MIGEFEYDTLFDEEATSDAYTAAVSIIQLLLDIYRV